MSTTRLHRLILAVYPERFRDRYGEELAAVAADCGGGWRVTFDLAVSAVKARLNPDPITSGSEGRRLRLETTTATVFALWVWSTVAVALFARAVDDQPVPGLRSWGWAAYEVGNVIFSLSAAAILIVGFVYWLLVVVPAIRTRNRADSDAGGRTGGCGCAVAGRDRACSPSRPTTSGPATTVTSRPRAPTLPAAGFCWRSTPSSAWLA